MKIRFLKAYNGDCIHINFIDDDGMERNILIDGGVADTYSIARNRRGRTEYGELYSLINEIRDAGKKIDLLILTHHHDDHINGILYWFRSDINALEIVTEVWFNSGAAIADWLKEEENKALDFTIT